MNRTRKIVRQWIAGALAVTMLSAAMAAPAFAAPEKTEDTTSETTAVVVDWSWTDAASLTWQEDTRSWMLSLAEDQTLSGADDLEALLPETVDAKITDAAVDTAETADASLALTWDTSALTFPLEDGDYTVTAALPEGYVLAEGVPALAVTVQVPGENTDTTEDAQLPPAGNSIQRAPQANQPSLLANGIPDTVETVDPVGTTINLFDYWIRGQEDTGGDQTPLEKPYNPEWWEVLKNPSDGDLGRGINKDHILKFTRGGLYDDSMYYTNGGNLNNAGEPYQNIVKNKLVGGFPQLNSDTVKSNWAVSYVGTQYNCSESLNYLFDPTVRNSARADYVGVKGLLSLDENGYYSYDSAVNYAQYNETTNTFTVYDQPNLGFFPFDNFRDVTKQSDGDIVANHYFGLTMTTRFVQQNGGRTTDGRNAPITYEFSGDDDVWVFIDGVLVGDLGGIHGAISLNIDFSTGEIVVNGKQEETLYDKFADAHSTSDTKWNGNNTTFADNTSHTLQLFYLERGNYKSNLKLKFNMESVFESSVRNVDQNGNGIAATDFVLYATDEDYNPESGTTFRFEGGTESDGVLKLRDKNGHNIKLQDLKAQNYDHFVLQEINTPAGYRSSTVPVHLKFLEGVDDPILLCENPWESGAYANPAVTATLPQTVQTTDGTSIDTLNTSGIFFAVVLKRKANGANDADGWQPVYGDPIDQGWSTLADASNQNILTAAQNNPYLFKADNSGLRTTIENLPGSLREYYYILAQTSPQTAEDDAQYTVAYFYTSDTSLENANPDNIKRLRTDDVTREFSAQVCVSNVKNYLIVQQTDADGTRNLEGATYELYKDDGTLATRDGQLLLNDEGKPYSANDTEKKSITPYDSVTTQDLDRSQNGLITAEGSAVFPSEGHVLTPGNYYVLEASAAEGYQATEQIVKVIVNDTGVYADAGTQDDDVTVLRGAGKIVRSMLQFAMPDAINTTLADITATLNTLPEGQDPSTFQDWTSTGQTMNLSYHASDVPLEYGLSAGEGDPYFVVDEGWSRVTITQNYNNGQLAHNEAGIPNAGPKEEVTNDLTNLFSRSTIVRVKNEVQLCSLTINDLVEKPVGNDHNQLFTVTVALTEGDKAPLASSYKYEGRILNVIPQAEAPADGTLNLNNGQGNVQLSDGQAIVIKDIPYGTQFAVTETASNYTVSYTVTAGDTAPLSNNGTGQLIQDTTVAITNTRKTGGVSLTQNVSGPMGSYSDAFTYTLKLYDPGASQGVPITGTYQGTFTPKSGTAQPVTVTFAGSGTAAQITVGAENKTISLQDGDVLSLTDLPAGAVCEVTEDTNTLGYTTAVGDQSTLSGTVTVPAEPNDAASITFTNTRAAITPTGLREENAPYIAMVGLAGVAALLAAGGWVRTRRRRREED